MNWKLIFKIILVFHLLQEYSKINNKYSNKNNRCNKNRRLLLIILKSSNSKKLKKFSIIIVIKINNYKVLHHSNNNLKHNLYNNYCFSNKIHKNHYKTTISPIIIMNNFPINMSHHLTLLLSVLPEKYVL